MLVLATVLGVVPASHAMVPLHNFVLPLRCFCFPDVIAGTHTCVKKTALIKSIPRVGYGKAQEVFELSVVRLEELSQILLHLVRHLTKDEEAHQRATGRQTDRQGLRDVGATLSKPRSSQ